MWGAAVALACGLTPAAWGQVDVPGAAPAAATATAATPGAAATATAAAPQRNLWTFLCPPQEWKDRCKEKFCRSTFGQLINNSFKPASALTGGVIPGCCPPVLKSDLLKPADSAEGAAARIKQDEANAKARRAAVRYLGTVDCRYWPEARDALVNALRADRNECVRMEAAWSLGRGCCCNKVTMQALILTVTGSDADGNPQEPSERVRIAAEYALRRCLDCYVEVERVKPKTAEPLPPPKKVDEEEPIIEEEKKRKVGQNIEAGPSDGMSPYYQRVSLMKTESIVAAGRKAIESRPTVTSVPPPGSDFESRSLATIWKNTMGAQAPVEARPVTSSEPARLPQSVVRETVVVQQAPVQPRTTTQTAAMPTAPAAPQPAAPQQPAKPRGLLSRAFEKAPAQPAPVSTPVMPERVVVSETTTVITPAPKKPEASVQAPEPVVTPPAVARKPAPDLVPPPLPPVTTPVQTPVSVPAPAPIVPVVSKPTEVAPPIIMNLAQPPAKPREEAPAPASPAPVMPPAPAPAPAPKATIMAPLAPAPVPAPAKELVKEPVIKPAVTPTAAMPASKPSSPEKQATVKAATPSAAPVTPAKPRVAETTIPVTKAPEPSTPAPAPAKEPVIKPAATPSAAAPASKPALPEKPATVKAATPSAPPVTLAEPRVVEMTAPVTKAPETPAPARMPAPAPTGAPAGTPVSRMTATVPVAAPVSQPRWVEAVRPTPPSAPAMPKEQLVKLFCESVDPSRREWAAEQLGRVPGAGADDRVAQALLAGANADPAPMVRVACLNSIHQLRIMDYQLGGILQRLKGDSDVRVKQTAQAVDRWLQDEVARCVNRPATKVR
jgi:hypothetical protein